MTPPVGLRVVTFNSEHGNGGDAGALGRACSGLDADVLALQEVDVRVPRSLIVARVAEVTVTATHLSVEQDESALQLGVTLPTSADFAVVRVYTRTSAKSPKVVSQ
ncbi:MAG: hypothetical protein KY443_00485 [Actinobacteria bacterium]|nr:hypothetical protein [Actinomycetota bacterium]